ncbi:FKBP-type peptidyl-prolyl cis-trans isomerase N-terminal domain-containing protein [Buttiauxella agrestis]|uniref:FKBP-type peptidyl-prolyl cis-trans isomerase N-terminal domain-containing protein n=1 Tax=Buttiauxella agrestis TaxID=82977 RepID=UPI003CD0D8DF
MAKYIEDQIAEQKLLHMTLDKDILLAGMMDAFNHQQKMSDNEVRDTLSVFDEQVKVLTAAENRALANHFNSGFYNVNPFAVRAFFIDNCN